MLDRAVGLRRSRCLDLGRGHPCGQVGEDRRAQRHTGLQPQAGRAPVVAPRAGRVSVERTCRFEGGSTGPELGTDVQEVDEDRRQHIGQAQGREGPSRAQGASEMENHGRDNTGLIRV